MTANEIYRGVQIRLSGIKTLSREFGLEEIKDAINEAQLRIVAAISSFRDRYTEDDFAATDPNEAEDLAPAEFQEPTKLTRDDLLDDSGVEVSLHKSTHPALITMSTIILNEKTGEYPNALKNRNSLWNQFNMEIGIAKSVIFKTTNKKTDRIINYQNPYGGSRGRW